jgi:hypothetical protein
MSGSRPRFDVTTGEFARRGKHGSSDDEAEQPSASRRCRSSLLLLDPSRRLGHRSGDTRASRNAAVGSTAPCPCAWWSATGGARTSTQRHARFASNTTRREQSTHAAAVRRSHPCSQRAIGGLQYRHPVRAAPTSGRRPPAELPRSDPNPGARTGDALSAREPLIAQRGSGRLGEDSHALRVDGGSGRSPKQATLS